MIETNRRKLRAVALEQYGYVTAADERALGLPKGELRNISRRGGLTQVHYGIYRFDDIPVTERDPYMEAVLWAGPDAVLSHDAVLALLGLADANPRTLRVTTGKRNQRQPIDAVTLVHGVMPAEEKTVLFGIPTTTVARAIRDSRGLIMHERLVAAAHAARAEGYLLEREYRALLDELGAPDA